MLPNHAPLVIAEQFGTLAQLFPRRIDLGLGRAPGTDQTTAFALRRSFANADNFPQDVLELQAYLAPAQEGQRVQAVPATGTEVPLWILGSSTFGAQLAAALGLPYGFASHFAPDQLLPALEIYRTRFTPSAQLAQPYAMVGVNVIAAETDAEAKFLATTQQMSFTNIFRGARGLSQPPIARYRNILVADGESASFAHAPAKRHRLTEHGAPGFGCNHCGNAGGRAHDPIGRVRSRSPPALVPPYRRGNGQDSHDCIGCLIS